MQPQDVSISDYLIPGANEVVLDDALAKIIRQRFDMDRDNRFERYVLAAGIRNQHLDRKTNTYSAEFIDWYSKHKMEKLFGSRQNFSKYASAGDVINHTSNGGAGSGTEHARPPEEYLKQLPLGLGTLFEICQILTMEPDGKEMFRKCFHMKSKRVQIGESEYDIKSVSTALIRPNVTGDEVRNWRRDWENPPLKKPPRVDKRTMSLATIKVSGDLFEFDTKANTAGDKIGCLDLEEVETLLEKLKLFFSKEDPNQFLLSYEEEIKHLTTGYFQRKEQADPANRISGKIDRYYGMNRADKEAAKLRAARKRKKSRQSISSN